MITGQDIIELLKMKVINNKQAWALLETIAKSNK
jgi:hypothetical protein